MLLSPDAVSSCIATRSPGAAPRPSTAQRLRCRQVPSPDNLPQSRTGWVRTTPEQIEGEKNVATVRAALIQAKANMSKQDAIDKQIGMLEDAVAKGAKIACLQEIFYGPYFCAQQGNTEWFRTAENAETGPT